MTRWYAGVDCSTQSLKILLIDAQHVIHHQVSVHFDSELPKHYGIVDGVTRATYGLPADVEAAKHIADDKLIVTSPSLMFVDALELALSKLVAQGVDFSKIEGISGSGQQHGSVFWKAGAHEKLSALSTDKSLVDQLKDAFSVPNGPIWMDSSTSAQCKSLQAAVNGPQAMADITGSRAYERFTGNQIMKIASLFPEQYVQTERISLVSSMLACLWTGAYQGIDASDGAGMNLMDISTQQWSASLLQAADPTGQLGSKLGLVVPSTTVVGTIHSYFVKKYGFAPDCKIVASSGDNPCTLAGLELKEPGDVGVSLGTSDTLFAVVEKPKPSGDEGHVFINPVDTNTAMLMVCFKNGSLTRQKIRDQVVGGSWDLFNEALKVSQPGNGSNLMFTYLEPEITPTTHKAGVIRFNKAGEQVPTFDELNATASPSANLSSAQVASIRALVEGQFLGLKAHSEHLGLATPKRIVASGGASVNWNLLQVLADVFQAPVEVQVVKDTKTGADASSMMNTAALGAAYRALWAIHGKDHKAESPAAAASSAVEAVAISFVRAATPRTEFAQVYADLLAQYKRLEPIVVQQLQ